MKRTMEALGARGRGIIDISQSMATMNKRFAKLRIESSQSSRLSFRQSLFVPGSGYLSGVLLENEMLYSRTKDAISITELCEACGVIPGIQVDEGFVNLPGFVDDSITTGPDKTLERLSKYYAEGVRFARWRARFVISKTNPSDASIDANCHALALFALMCQKAAIVPLLDLDFSSDGDYDLSVSYGVRQTVVRRLLTILDEYKVLLSRAFVCFGMVSPGKDCDKQSSVAEVAEATVRLLSSMVPADQPDPQLGGQANPWRLNVLFSDRQATEASLAHLNAVAQIKHPPQLTFSFCYDQTLLQEALDIWAKDMTNTAEVRGKVLERLAASASASIGHWKG
jgi:fructose-bisphosphate aldolase class I